MTITEEERNHKKLGCERRTYLISYECGGEIKVARVTCCLYDYALYRFYQQRPDTQPLKVTWKD